jgi:hypothetical protein
MNTKEMKQSDKIYISNHYTMSIDEVYLAQDLNETQILIENDGRFNVVHKNQITTEEQYNLYIESMYKDNLKKFRDYVLYSKVNKSLLLRMMDDLNFF